MKGQFNMAILIFLKAQLHYVQLSQAGALWSDPYTALLTVDVVNAA